MLYKWCSDSMCVCFGDQTHWNGWYTIIERPVANGFAHTYSVYFLFYYIFAQGPHVVFVFTINSIQLYFLYPHICCIYIQNSYLYYSYLLYSDISDPFHLLESVDNSRTRLLSITFIYHNYVIPHSHLSILFIHSFILLHWIFFSHSKSKSINRSCSIYV